ncbi:MAG: protein-glutamate O-methyltransferase CheR [Ignavibacterium sp.]
MMINNTLLSMKSNSQTNNTLDFISIPNIFSISDNSFNILRNIIYDYSGIYFQDNKKYLLESRLQKRIKHLNLNSFDEYINLFQNNSVNGEEHKYLMEAVTINETFFFRNQSQLDVMVKYLIPEIIELKRKSGSKTFRIWSAASSSGDEPYSISMVLKEFVISKYPDFQFNIIASDISKAMIETAKKGVYREYSVRNAPPYYIKKYFKNNSEFYNIDGSIKQMVEFRTANLYDEKDLITLRNFDLIFCLNVLIYFDTKSKMKVVSNLYNSLNKGGYLFIGPSENLHGISKAFKLQSFAQSIVYKKE